MASVKKTMKSSETKQAKPGTRSPKAKVSKRPPDPADSKTRKTAAARAVTAKAAAAKRKTVNKVSTKVSAKPSTKKAAAKTSASKAAMQRPKTRAAAPSRMARTSAKAGNKAAAAARRTAKNAGAHAKGRAVSLTGHKKPSAARTAAVKRGAEAKPVSTIKEAAARKAMPVKAPALKAADLKAPKPAALKAAQPAAHAVQKPAAGALDAAPMPPLTVKPNEAQLAEVHRQAAPAPSNGPNQNSSNLSLEPNERMAVNKEPDKNMSITAAAGQADTNAAHPKTKGAARKDLARGPAKGADLALSGKPAVKEAVKEQVSKAPPPAPEAAAAAAPLAAEAKPAVKPASPAPKSAKAASSQRQFKPGEFVVYPAHGVGQIVAVEEQEVAGFKLELFVISFIKDKMILKVPTPKVASVGMRKLSDAPAVKAALDTLAGRARVKRTMWSRRAQEYEAKINSGDLIAIAEVVRDLYRSDTQPEQSYSERQLYEAALDRMMREIVVVQKLTETESLKLIEAQLQKGPRRSSKAEEIDSDEPEIEEAA